MEATTSTNAHAGDDFVAPKTKSRKRKQPSMDTSDISNPAEKRPHFKPLKAIAGSVCPKIFRRDVSRSGDFGRFQDPDLKTRINSSIIA